MRRGGTVALAVGAGIVLVALVAGGIRAAGGVVRRPEGAAERFLQAVSRGDREGIGEYGARAAVADLTGFEREDDRDFFTAVEVGRGRKFGDVAIVPFRFERRDRKGTVVTGALQLEKEAGSPPEWRVFGPVKRAPGQKVPSEGGPAPAEAPAAFWVAGVALGVAVTLGAEAILRLTRPRPRSTLRVL